jgi:RimJ/RimL family protein N-acetyltransferase
MSESEAIAIRPMTLEDLPLFRRWLEEPHVRAWWGEPDQEVANVRDMIEGRDTTEPYIFGLDGRPIGYIQVWFLGHHQNETWLADNPWLAAFPADAVGVDLTIGEEKLLSQGIGSTVLRRFVAELRARGFSTIIIDPDPANSRAIRAYEKAGFRAVPHLQGKTADVLLMQHHEIKD